MGRSDSNQPPISFLNHWSACLTVGMRCIRRSDGISKFRIVHPMVPQFRAGSYKTCNLTIRRKHMEAASDLSTSAGLRSFTAPANIHLLSPYHPSPALNGGGFPDGFSSHLSNPVRYFSRGFVPTTQRMAGTPVRGLAGTCQIFK